LNVSAALIMHNHNADPAAGTAFFYAYTASGLWGVKTAVLSQQFLR